jgi:hypothetical protein
MWANRRTNPSLAGKSVCLLPSPSQKLRVQVLFLATGAVGVIRGTGVMCRPCWHRVNYVESVTQASNELPITWAGWLPACLPERVYETQASQPASPPSPVQQKFLLRGSEGQTLTRSTPWLLCKLYHNLFKDFSSSSSSSLPVQSCVNSGLPFGFPNEFSRHTFGLLGRMMSTSQGLYLHRTTQHWENKDELPCFERDLNPRPRVRALKSHALDRVATGSAFNDF